MVNGDISYNSAEKSRIDAERLAVLKEARYRNRPRKESNVSIDSASETLESLLMEPRGDELILDIESLSPTSTLSDVPETRRSRRSTMRRSLNSTFSFMTNKTHVTESGRRRVAKSSVIAARIKAAASTVRAQPDVTCSVRDGGHRFDLLVLERATKGTRRPTGLEVAASNEPLDFGGTRYPASLIVLGCKYAAAVPTVQQAWNTNGVRTGDRIVAVNGARGPAEALLALLRKDTKKRRLTLVRPAEASGEWTDSSRAVLFV